MKKVLAFCILAAVPVLAGEGTLTDSERSFLVEQLQLSKKAFLASIDGVTDAQWKFKASPTSWSIAECAEHIVLSEDFLFGAAQGILPSGKFPTPADAARAFTEKRDRDIAYAKTTTDDLRVHSMKGPMGIMDSYQFLLLMASHTGRHTDQIKEVQANADYPKATTAERLNEALTSLEKYRQALAAKH